MADDRRPTEEEIEELIGLTRRDPGSPAFVDLGDAYLALGRAREAIDVASAGLGVAPDNVEGRMMLARAHASLHQWKEAQVELLKVVKVDRANKLGFALLGEVLMRRADYERAIPVLQHAQNLDPANPAVLALLKRARAGQPLDPPAPVPTPQQARRSAAPAPAPAPPARTPRASAPPPVAAAPRPAPAPPPAAAPPPTRTKGPTRPPPAPARPVYDDGPTSVAEPRGGFDPGVTGEATAVRGDPTEVTSGRGDPTDISPPRHDVDERAPARLPLEPKNDSRPVAAIPAAAPAAHGHAPAAAAAAPAAGVRPRVIPAAKPVNAAAASLRQSAAVGENYLNDLLTGGLLDVPGVRVPDSDFDIKPGKRWGRSTTRTFIALFTLLVVGTGAGVGWYLWSEKKKAEELAEHRKASDAALAPASWDGLTKSMTELTAALDLDKSSTLTFAEVAQTAALEHLLYNPAQPDVATITKAITSAQEEIKKPDQPGFRELLIARAAIALADLSDDPNAAASLGKTRQDLEAWLTGGHDSDRWARWLLARVDLAEGQRSKAANGLREAADAPTDADRLVIAIIDRADLLVDDGQLADADKLYDQALKIAPQHPLALLGKALEQTDAAAEASKSMNDLSVPLDKELGPRVAGWRHLWLASANRTLEYYQPAKEELDKASAQGGPTEARFLARVALQRVLAGDLVEAAKTRAAIVWYGHDPKVKPETDPQVALVDAALLLASGLPSRALDAAKGDTVRAQLLRGQALLDLGKYKEALGELDAAAKTAPDTVEVQILDDEARVLASSGKEREAALTDLDKIARKKTKLGRHAQGVALMLSGGDAKEAASRLGQALDGISDDEPNPVAYRTHTALAQLALRADPPDLAAAGKELDAAITANLGYLPARALRARLLVQQGKPDDALADLDPVMKEKDTATADNQLVLAEALATRQHVDADKKDTTDQDKADAKAALQAAKDGGASPDEIGRVAALVDPGLPAELGVPAPAAPKGGAAPAPTAPKGGAGGGKKHHK